MQLLIKFSILFLLCSGFSLATLTLTVDSSAVNLGKVAPADGFYGDQAGNVRLTCETNAGESWILNASISQKLTSSKGYSFGSDALKWKGYFIDRGNFTKADWSAYPLSAAGEETIAVSDGSQPVVNVLLGTLIYVPSVMPEGDYQTNIVYTLTN